MAYELWLSWRYLLAKRRERFISVIAVLSIGGVAIGVMALLLVLSVMSGFDYELKEKLVGTNAHITIEAEHGIRDADVMMRTVAATAHVEGVSPFVTGQAIIRLPDRAFGVLVRGIDPEREPRVSKLRDYLVAGHLPQEDREVIVGIELARSLGVGMGDALRLLSPADGKAHDVVIGGIFRSGMYEYDANLICMTLEGGQRLFGLEQVVSGLAVRLDSVERAVDVRRALALKLGDSARVRTWMEVNQTLFDALRLEKITMFIILTLIVIVAAVNIISTLIMMVVEKTRDIGILKSIGATSRSIRLIFTWQGFVIGVLGTALGLAAAAGIIWLQARYQLVQLPSSVYYVDRLPVRIEPGDWGLTIAAAIIVSFLATLYPARQAATLMPVDALRYE